MAEMIGKLRLARRSTAIAAAIVAVLLIGVGTAAACFRGGPDKTASRDLPTIQKEVPAKMSSTVEEAPDPAMPLATPDNTAPKSDTVKPTTTKSCADPSFTTSDGDGMESFGKYFVHNNMWNASEGAGPQTIYACNFNNWYVTSTQPNTTSVKTYPNAHKDYNNLDGTPINSFTSIKSTFAATSPHVGIYNVAYDIWINGVGNGGNTTELMIWTENYKQVPAGDKVATATFGGKTYDVWSEPDHKYIAMVPRQAMTSGTLDLKEMFDWIIAKGWLAKNSTVNQIGFGVEICSTGNKPATFKFTDFSVTES